jgi:hypothetical protein
MKGRHPHQPTPQTRAEVSALKSFGVPLDDIAAYIGIDRKTLSKHYKAEIDKAQTQANAAVAKFLYKAASGQALGQGATHSDCVRAAMFWAKTRMQWRETNHIDHTTNGKDLEPSRIIIEAASVDSEDTTAS